jgi:hypothetical protein
VDEDFFNRRDKHGDWLRTGNTGGLVQHEVRDPPNAKSVTYGFFSFDFLGSFATLKKSLHDLYAQSGTVGQLHEC